MMLRAVAGACVWVVACTSPIGTTPQQEGLSPSGVSPQVRSKADRTPAEQKIESHLLAAIDRVTAGLPPGEERSGMDVDAEGRVLVDVTAVVTLELLRQIEAVTGLVISQFPQYEAVRARLPFDKLVTLAERADVKFIRPAEQAVTNPVSGAPQRPEPR